MDHCLDLKKIPMTGSHWQQATHSETELEYCYCIPNVSEKAKGRSEENGSPSSNFVPTLF